MQQVQRYLLKNRVTGIINETGFATEYRIVYNRQINLYRGIKNSIEFKILNADQKPVNIALYTPRFQAFDENKNLVLDKLGESLDDGSSATRGLFKVTLESSDLLDLRDQFLSYTVFLIDADMEPVLVYSDTHFGNSGIAKLSSEAFPGAKASKTVNNFFQDSVYSTEWVSDSIDAEPAINSNSALHTAVVYTNNFIGDVIVESTLDVVSDSGVVPNWSTVATISFTGTEQEPVAVNYFGQFNYTRFRTTSDPKDKIIKILVKN